MFSPELLDHFQHPRNAGELDGASASVEVSNPVCGDILRLAVKVERGRIVRARFLCRGCATAIACASRLTELLSGNSLHQTGDISVEELARSLGGLPAETIHGAHLAIEAARAIAKKLQPGPAPPSVTTV
jgi:nitrogen fixation protein NifU and related proteins